ACRERSQLAERVDYIPARQVSTRRRSRGRITSSGAPSRRPVILRGRYSPLPQDGKEEVSMSKYLATLLAVAFALSFAFVHGGPQKETRPNTVRNFELKDPRAQKTVS